MSIDLYHCDCKKLERHISSPRISLETLRLYVKEVTNLIEQQKIDDKESETTATLNSSTRSSPRRASQRKAQRTARKRSRAYHDEEHDEFVPNNTNYDQLDDETAADSSSDDALLALDPTDIDNTDLEQLFSDNKSDSKKKKKKSTKKKKKKKRHRDKKKKKKRKKQRIQSTDDDGESDFDAKDYEATIRGYSMSQLRTAERTLLRQIKAEKDKSSHHKKASKKEEMSESDSESEMESLTMAQIQEKFQKLVEPKTTRSSSKRNKSSSKSTKDRTVYKEDPSKLYCVCRKPYDGASDMIQCDYCQEWYHLTCIGLSQDIINTAKEKKFKCPICNGADLNDVNGVESDIKNMFNSPKSSPNPSFVGAPNGEITKAKMEKYAVVISELQSRLSASKEQIKEYKLKLNKAKKQIDEEYNKRNNVEQTLNSAKSQSDRVLEDLGEKFKQQKEKEAELVNKLKKTEANKKKYKDNLSEVKKKMKAMKEEHENRVFELENEIIPTLNEKVEKEKKLRKDIEQKYHLLQQQRTNEQAGSQQALQTANYHLAKMREELNFKSQKFTKLLNTNCQLEYKLDALHSLSIKGHSQWMDVLKRHGVSVHSVNNLPLLPSIPSTPHYLKFNELELEELKMCRELCQKLLDANLFQIDHMAGRAQLSKELFIWWVSGMGPKQPTVINDLNVSNNVCLPQLDRTLHLSMNCIRMLLIEVRKQLETISNDNSDQYQNDIKAKCKRLLREFQTASQEYEQKMNDFKSITRQRLLERCRNAGSILEMFCVVSAASTNGNTDNVNVNGNECKSEWVKVSVCNFDAANNRVLVKKSNDHTMQYAAIDSATLRLPESDSMDDQILTTTTTTTTNTATTVSKVARYNGAQSANTPTNNGANNIQFNNISNHNTMNFNGIPSIPHIGNGILPPFDALAANNISNQHVVSNTISTNNNISINGANVCDPIVIDQSDEDKKTKKKKSSSHKRKRRRIKESDSDTSSSNDSDDSMSSDSETESESINSKKSKKRNKKSSKSSSKKKSKKKSKKTKSKKKRKRGRPKKNENNEDEERSVSASIASSKSATTRKRRGVKRSLSDKNGSSHHQKSAKRRKLTNASSQFDTITGGGDSDKNDSVCRICKHPGDLVCCEGCPSSYHADCIRPRVRQEWLDKFEEWYCPSCAPQFAHIPLVDKKSKTKWPMNKEPLLKNLKEFLKKHSFLEIDHNPNHHSKRVRSH